MTETPREPDTPPHLRVVAMPRDTNPGGFIFGGWTLSQMDLAGGVFAAREAQGPVATVAIGNARNAGLLAVRILATGDDALRARMEAFQADLADAARGYLGFWGRVHGEGRGRVA